MAWRAHSERREVQHHPRSVAAAVLDSFSHGANSITGNIINDAPIGVSISRPKTTSLHRTRSTTPMFWLRQGPTALAFVFGPQLIACCGPSMVLREKHSRRLVQLQSSRLTEADPWHCRPFRRRPFLRRHRLDKTTHIGPDVGPRAAAEERGLRAVVRDAGA
jgi:hypothetical protein